MEEINKIYSNLGQVKRQWKDCHLLGKVSSLQCISKEIDEYIRQLFPCLTQSEKKHIEIQEYKLTQELLKKESGEKEYWKKLAKSRDELYSKQLNQLAKSHQDTLRRETKNLKKAFDKVIKDAIIVEEIPEDVYFNKGVLYVDHEMELVFGKAKKNE